ncbi:MAG: ribonuclease III [Bacteroidetes bacterium HGW-Bacteroidetes-21]|jgi:ribonuclease-3|nr:MAG: ribonuclease III [Bacteroidetes bacterium HGW-Bacteroidetes-21]
MLSFRPRKALYYDLALTHRSASLHQTKGFAINNERLEFLGDSILNAIVSDFLFQKYPNENEGFLTQLKSKIVSRVILNEISVQMGIPQLITAHAPTAQTSNIYGNALEAIVGAAYLDRGYKKAYQFVVKRIILSANIDMLENTETNHKGRIIDWAQKKHIDYSFETEEMPLPSNNGKKFYAKLIIGEQTEGTGSGDSKKEAEQNAAHDAWQKLGL